MEANGNLDPPLVCSRLKFHPATKLRLAASENRKISSLCRGLDPDPRSIR